MSLASCLYHGWVRHRRFEPVENTFTYRVFFAYLDLDELDRVFAGRWFWSTSRGAIARFRREDHFGSPNEPLSESVRNLVEHQTGSRPTGPVRVLTQLRFWGYLMNPVAFFYCFNEAGTEVESVVAEVTNTPWGERHCYVLDAATLTGTGPNTQKEFHVSPFMEMNMEYAWRVGTPGTTLSMHIDEPRTAERQDASPRPAAANDRPPFDVTMSLERRPITTGHLAKTLIRHPFMTGKIAAAIYWQALKLWWKGVPFVPHPDRARERSKSSPLSPASETTASLTSIAGESVRVRGPQRTPEPSTTQESDQPALGQPPDHETNTPHPSPLPRSTGKEVGTSLTGEREHRATATT